MATLTGISATIKRLKEAVKDLEQEGVREVQSAALAVLDNLIDLTPVWEGTVVRNYSVGVGGRPSGAEKSAIDNGPPGPTNTMSIGEEPRRGPNAAAARAEAASSVKAMKRLQNVHIGNNAEHFDLVENGNAPTASTARNEGGISLLALQRSAAKLKHFKRGAG